MNEIAKIINQKIKTFATRIKIEKIICENKTHKLDFQARYICKCGSFCCNWCIIHNLKKCAICMDITDVKMCEEHLSKHTLYQICWKCGVPIMDCLKCYKPFNIGMHSYCEKCSNKMR